MSLLKAVDLFCGAGGSSRGLLDANINVVGAYDCWESAIDVYNHNIPGQHGKTIDLADTDAAVKEIAKLEVDIISGSPPCQDFSHVGKLRSGKWREGNNSDLTPSFINIIEKIRPKAMLMENVPQVAGTHIYYHSLSRLTDYGYRTVELVLNASLFGVPQRRKRFFLFAYSAVNDNDENKRIASRFLKAIDGYRASLPLTVKEYLGDEIDVENYFYIQPIATGEVQTVFSVHEPAPTIRGNNASYIDKDDQQKHHKDVAHPRDTNKLSERLHSRIQTFPPDWDWSATSKTSMIKQIGNAVPPQLAHKLGLSIRYALTGHPEPPSPQLEDGQLPLL